MKYMCQSEDCKNNHLCSMYLLEIPDNEPYNMSSASCTCAGCSGNTPENKCIFMGDLYNTNNDCIADK